MSELWRLFIALELPSPVLAAIKSLQDDLKYAIPRRAARWSRPEGIHLTLKFLGDVPAERVEFLVEAIRATTRLEPAFDLTVLGIGCFPDKKRPRVLWAGVGGETELLHRLRASLEQHIAPLGYSTEERSFSPHLTLARSAPGASHEEVATIGRVASERDIGQLAEWHVSSASLMRSTLLPDGAHYECVGEAALNGKQT